MVDNIGQDSTSLVSLARRAATVAAVVAGFVAVFAMVVFASDVFLLAFAGILVSVFLRGLATALASRTPLSYGWSLAVALLCLLGLAAGLGFIVVPSATSQAHDLRQQLPDAIGRLQSRIEGVDWLSELAGKVPPPSEMIGRRADVWSRITGFFSTALGLVTDVVVIVFVGLYIAVSPDLYRRGVLALVPPRHRDRAKSVLKDLDEALWWWLIAKLIAMGLVGVLTGLGLWWLRIPAPIALGTLAALLTFIPNLGPILAAAPAIVLAMTQGLQDAGFVVLLYLGIQTIESYLITPNIEKKTINLPPALTISVQLLLGMLAGGLGLLVPTPLCAATLVLVRDLYVQDATDK
jgi:predicted PurR-regulated permease PerM